MQKNQTLFINPLAGNIYLYRHFNFIFLGFYNPDIFFGDAANLLI
ncbi:hypothetical protein AB84_2108 [Escherichia coli 2-052-05_S3_C1]|nr:hypothetical protein AB84_2108 [Escherichia coli 2-052-05_S3_C1]KDV84705.1 hypothetical protein AC42_2046 [Escherichia coli 2-052-05_S3_C3]KEN77856.1 hypothetical protein AC14_2100 [Escherichia coli 2-052-05_S3_C2]